MNDESLKNLDFTNKETLEALIEQTYVIENEYNALKESFASLQQMMSEIVEVLPNALWVLNKDKSIH